MKNIVSAAFVIVLPLLTAQCCVAAEWHGLTPLRSTRRDVVRILNQCADQEEACAFTLGDEDVYILFSGGLTKDHNECAERLPPQTIVFIDVELRKSASLKDLRLNKTAFQAFNPIDPNSIELKGFKGYWLQSEGLLLSELHGKVIELAYIPTGNDRSRCSTFYAQPTSLIKVAWVHVPIVNVTSSPQEVRAGEVIVFRAWSNANARRGYAWTVTAGRIISGQNTSQIIVETSGSKADSIVATAEVSDVFRHAAVGSCRVRIQSPVASLVHRAEQPISACSGLAMSGPLWIVECASG